MSYIIIDLEATDSSPREVIEIGAVKLDENLNITDTFQSFIKPKINSILSDFIKKLTKIDQQDVDSAESFSRVYDKFLSWAGEKPSILTWGKMDKKFILSSISIHNADASILKCFKNIQRKVSLILNHSGNIGLKMAMQLSGLTQEGESHRALNDAIDTSKLFVKYFKEINEFKHRDLTYKKKQKKENIDKINFGKYSYVTINYKKYKKHLEKQSIFQLRVKINMLDKLLKEEQSKNGISRFLVVLSRKKSFSEKILSLKIYEDYLSTIGLTSQNVKILIKSSNILYNIKTSLIVQTNQKSIDFYIKMQRNIAIVTGKIKKIEKMGKKSINKHIIIQYQEEILSLLYEILESEFLNHQKEQELRSIESSILENLKDIKSLKKVAI